MVLQPTGCGRVGHRHNTLHSSGQEPNGSWPLRFIARETPVVARTASDTTASERTRAHVGPLNRMRALSTPCGTCVLFDSGRGSPAKMQAVKYMTIQQT